MFAWDFGKNGRFSNYEPSIIDCLNEAKQCVSEMQKEHKPNYIYIGEVEQYIPEADAISILERLIDIACDIFDCTWWRPDYVDEKDIDKLNDDLTEILLKWLEDHGLMPEFGEIKNIKQYKL